MLWKILFQSNVLNLEEYSKKHFLKKQTDMFLFKKIHNLFSSIDWMTWTNDMFVRCNIYKIEFRQSNFCYKINW